MEGRFCQVSGVKFKFDPKRPAGDRVSGVSVGGDELDFNNKYLLATVAYVKDGKDGFDSIFQGKCLIDEENGPDVMSTIQNFLKCSQNEKFRKEYKLCNTDFKKVLERKKITGLKGFKRFRSKISLLGKLAAGGRKSGSNKMLP